ncbi:MAG: hypothetical protein PHW69_04380 [Elusimicrobiaceae bacterium]|nr:hypothetical protein [Elusimicrobiaceae bacterium]
MRTYIKILLLLAVFLPGAGNPGYAFQLPWKKDKAQQAPATEATSAETGYGAWQNCVSSATMYLPLGNSRQLGKLDPNCRPDTLYSWGPDLKLISFLSCASNPGEACDLAKRSKVASQIWKASFPRAIFATVSPITTFGYGDIMFRIKLKPDTRFAFLIDPPDSSHLCNTLSPDQTADTVIVRNWHIGTLYGLDYIICGTGPIHSWSVGTRQGYEELSRAYNWTRSHRHWIPYVAEKSDRSILFNRNLDSNSFSPRHLNKNFALMKKMIEKGEGGVFFSPGVTKSADAHFSTGMKSYWNAN